MKSYRYPTLEKISTYYKEKLAEHGANPKGVDWNNKEGQTLRFDKLLSVIRKGEKDFSVNDLNSK